MFQNWPQTLNWNRDEAPKYIVAGIKAGKHLTGIKALKYFASHKQCLAGLNEWAGNPSISITGLGKLPDSS